MSRLLLFDPHASGHHADHIFWIASAWAQRPYEGDLILAVDERQFEDSPELLRLASSPSIQAHPLPPDPGGPLHQIARHAYKHLSEVTARYHPNAVVATYMDSLQPALALRVSLPSETRLAGVLFRPDLHYTALGFPPRSLGERLNRTRKRVTLRQALRHRRLSDVFSLDPTAVSAIRAMTQETRVHALPDPAFITSPTQDVQSVRSALGVEPGRHLGLLIGSLTERKGVSVLFRSLGHLRPHEARRLTVVLAGRALGPYRARLTREIRELRESTDVQLIYQDGFVPDDQVQNLIAAADQVLAPYQRHTGSSGIVMRAAAAGVPVLSQSWGLMGHQVQTHRLGQTLDTSDSTALAAALVRAMEMPHTGFDARSAAAFATRHTVKAFTSRLLDTFLPPP
ncbi:MAG: glycosyltransferase [Bacteroidota bacterium]